MKQNEKDKETAKRIQTLAVCGCLCLLAVGAGVTYRAFDRSGSAQTEMETAEPRPVTATQTPALDTALLGGGKQSRDAGETPDAPQQKPATPVKETPKAEPAKPEAAEPTFAYPLKGEVVLPYSVDHAIYDPTLEQYHTNAGISLSAAEGTEVKAAADGTVKEIKKDSKTGNTVTLEHSNGWLTTYGQLEDDVKVKEGDSVKQGQAIGTVDAPTKYGVALGSHLEFAMEKNGTTVDPEEKLKEE